MTTPTTATTSPLPAIVTRLSPIAQRLLALGMPMGPNVLITVRGRKSGTPHTFPVALLEVDGRTYLFSAFGEVQWVQNLRAAGELTIRRGRKDLRMTAVELDPEVAAPCLAAGLKPVMKVPLIGSMIAGWYSIDKRSTADDYRASAREHPAFELTPAGA
jgi:deazaflavin-dependent oxidoreductase (nitroreductase family)